MVVVVVEMILHLHMIIDHRHSLRENNRPLRLLGLVGLLLQRSKDRRHNKVGDPGSGLERWVVRRRGFWRVIIEVGTLRRQHSNNSRGEIQAGVGVVCGEGIMLGKEIRDGVVVAVLLHHRRRRHPRLHPDMRVLGLDPLVGDDLA